MSGAGAVAALVLLEWTTGTAAAAAWTQLWNVVRRGHFRIAAWTVLVLALLAKLSLGTVADAAVLSLSGPPYAWLSTVLVVVAALYVAAQYVRSERVGALAGAVTAALGVAILWMLASRLGQWSVLVAVVHLFAGAALIGAVSNGMLLGHWYLNQPGLKPWALARLTQLSLAAIVAVGVAGIATAPRLAGAATSGAVLGLPGFGESFALVFYAVWLGLLVFTGVVVWMARRCVRIRSIQSATGLYYVALLTAGVSEFVVRYLMVNSA